MKEPVAVPGFDHSGDVDFVNGRGARKSLKECKLSFFACLTLFLLKCCFNINRERRQLRKISVFRETQNLISDHGRKGR